MLRGLAALAVVLCHLRELFKGTEYWKAADRWLMPGAFGVDLFFIISGFIITYTGFNYTNKQSLIFFMKRVFRVWPPYAIWTLIFILYFYGLNINDQLLINTMKSLSFIPLKTDTPIYFGSAVLYPGWTLNYEMYFYLIFSICILFGRFRIIVLISWIIISVINLPMILNLNPGKPFILGGGYLNLMMQQIILEFIFGAVCALIYRDKQFQLNGNIAPSFALLFAIAIPAVAYIYNIRANDHGPQKFGMFLMPSFLLLIISSDFISRRIRFPSFMVKLGDISYSWYLCHVIVIAASIELVEIIGTGKIASAFLTISISLPASIFIAYISNLFIERKLCGFISKSLIKN